MECHEETYVLTGVSSACVINSPRDGEGSQDGVQGWGRSEGLAMQRAGWWLDWTWEEKRRRIKRNPTVLT